MQENHELKHLAREAASVHKYDSLAVLLLRRKWRKCWRFVKHSAHVHIIEKCYTWIRFKKMLQARRNLLRVRPPKNQILSDKFQNFEIAQTFTISGPYWTIYRYVVHMSNGVLARHKMTILDFGARYSKIRLKMLAQKLAVLKLTACCNYNPEDIHLQSAYSASFAGFIL